MHSRLSKKNSKVRISRAIGKTFKATSTASRCHHSSPASGRAKTFLPRWKKPAMWWDWICPFAGSSRLWNPSLKNSTSRTLVLNLQMLKPGEHALSHRHMAGAIRFILKGHGTRLIVEGESFEIGEGDFVTTPSWTWHDHENRGETMMWLDGLDAPLVQITGNRFSRTRSAQETDGDQTGRLHAGHRRRVAPGVDETQIPFSRPPFATSGPTRKML